MTHCTSAEHGFLCEINSSPFRTQHRNSKYHCWFPFRSQRAAGILHFLVISLLKLTFTPMFYFESDETRSVLFVRKYGKTSRATDYHIKPDSPALWHEVVTTKVFLLCFRSIFICMFVWFEVDLKKMAELYIFSFSFQLSESNWELATENNQIPSFKWKLFSPTILPV